MSLTELASELNRTQVRNETENSIIVEHMLAARLVRIQARTSWRLGWFGLVGAILVALLTFYLGQLSVTSKNDSQIVATPSDSPKTSSIKNKTQPMVSTLKQKSSDSKAINRHNSNSTAKQQ